MSYWNPAAEWCSENLGAQHGQVLCPNSIEHASLANSPKATAAAGSGSLSEIYIDMCLTQTVGRGRGKKTDLRGH